MNDRCMFIQQEISCAFIDDFCVLPIEGCARLGNVFYGMTPAAERHSFLFNLTH